MELIILDIWGRERMIVVFVSLVKPDPEFVGLL